MKNKNLDKKFLSTKNSKMDVFVEEINYWILKFKEGVISER